MVLLHDGSHLFGRQAIVHAIIRNVTGEVVFHGFYSSRLFRGGLCLSCLFLLTELFRIFILSVRAVGTLSISVTVAVVVTILVVMIGFLISVIILISSIFFPILVHCKQF